MLYVNSVASAETCEKQNVDARILASGIVLFIATKAIDAGEEVTSPVQDPALYPAPQHCSTSTAALYPA